MFHVCGAANVIWSQYNCQSCKGSNVNSKNVAQIDNIEVGIVKKKTIELSKDLIVISLLPLQASRLD